MATETVTIPFIILLMFSLYYPFVIANEETRLHQEHGDAFLEFCKQTPRFFPSLANFSEPAMYTVDVRRYRKAIVDALWFIWLVGFLEIAEGLRSIEILPHLLTIL